MIRRSTWIVLFLFMVMLGVAWYLSRNPISKEEGVASPTPQAKLMTLGSGKITDLRIESNDGKRVELASSGIDTWQLKIPSEEAADNTSVNSAINQLQNADILSRLDPVPSAAAMGLDDPAFLIVLATDSGQQYNLEVGDETPTMSGYYIRLNNNEPVIVAKYSLSSVLTMR